ncbi:MAG: arginine N-succinyltransferase [Polyangiaceae bacterium]|nr:arginine N-succinyltransferase [Polyangiaceae bacterium]
MSAPPTFTIRAARPKDLASLHQLSTHLNSVNLPNNRDYLARLLDVSNQSFGGLLPAEERRYIFVAVEGSSGEIVGSSSIIGKLGTSDSPYIFLDVIEEEKYSSSLDQHFRHLALRIGFSFDGPSELGGLVLDPKYRRHPARLGRILSWVRFLFIACRRELFQAKLLAELLPPLEPDGTSHMWEAYGRRFCNMSYAEADSRSAQDKSFIRDLFPSGLVYASLMNEQAQAVIGQVGPQTIGVERMLRELGFRYAKRIDPFDGGPHYVANTDDVPAVADTRALRARIATPAGTGSYGLVGRIRADDSDFTAHPACLSAEGNSLAIPPALAERLDIDEGDELWWLPRLQYPDASLRPSK